MKNPVGSHKKQLPVVRQIASPPQQEAPIFCCHLKKHYVVGIIRISCNNSWKIVSFIDKIFDIIDVISILFSTLKVHQGHRPWSLVSSQPDWKEIVLKQPGEQVAQEVYTIQHPLLLEHEGTLLQWFHSSWLKNLVFILANTPRA